LFSGTPSDALVGQTVKSILVCPDPEFFPVLTFEGDETGKVYLHGNKAIGKKRTMSAAGRKRIAAAQRARWAKIRAKKK